MRLVLIILLPILLLAEVKTVSVGFVINKTIIGKIKGISYSTEISLGGDLISIQQNEVKYRCFNKLSSDSTYYIGFKKEDVSEIKVIALKTCIETLNATIKDLNKKVNKI